MARKTYQTDLSDKEWLLIEELLPVSQSAKGRKITHERREILNVIFWFTAAGCAWRMLAHDFPAWQTVYHYVRLWCKNGIWQRIHDEIYTKARKAEGREPEASAAAIDSQSVKAVALRSDHGVDVFKQTRGIKEHFSWTLEIVLRSDKSKGFVVLPKRWIVERTNAWLGHSRRLNRQYEVLHQIHEAFVYIAMTRLMLRRLDKAD